jgi:hypothetical protein
VTTGQDSAGPQPGAGIARPAQPQTVILDGPRLRQLRRQRGLSQGELAGQAGLSVVTVARLERQASAPCRAEHAGRHAEFRPGLGLHQRYAEDRGRRSDDYGREDSEYLALGRERGGGLAMRFPGGIQRPGFRRHGGRSAVRASRPP